MKWFAPGHAVGSSVFLSVFSTVEEYLRSSSGACSHRWRRNMPNSLGSFPSLTNNSEGKKKMKALTHKDKTKPGKRQQQQNFGNWKTGG